eukprot:SAG22_NODE_388_length_11295_cov_14.512594_7_plen_221_part_00
MGGGLKHGHSSGVGSARLGSVHLRDQLAAPRVPEEHLVVAGVRHQHRASPTRACLRVRRVVGAGRPVDVRDVRRVAGAPAELAVLRQVALRRLRPAALPRGREPSVLCKQTAREGTVLDINSSGTTREDSAVLLTVDVDRVVVRADGEVPAGQRLGVPVDLLEAVRELDVVQRRVAGRQTARKGTVLNSSSSGSTTEDSASLLTLTSFSVALQSLASNRQ